MSNAYIFMMTGAEVDDAKLTMLIRSSLFAQPERQRFNWLKQIELGLDGYGERHRDMVVRMRNILRLLALERRIPSSA